MRIFKFVAQAIYLAMCVVPLSGCQSLFKATTYGHHYWPGRDHATMSDLAVLLKRNNANNATKEPTELLMLRCGAGALTVTLLQRSSEDHQKVGDRLHQILTESIPKAQIKVEDWNGDSIATCRIVTGYRTPGSIGSDHDLTPILQRFHVSQSNKAVVLVSFGARSLIEVGKDLGMYKNSRVFLPEVTGDAHVDMSMSFKRAEYDLYMFYNSLPLIGIGFVPLLAWLFSLFSKKEPTKRLIYRIVAYPAAAVAIYFSFQASPWQLTSEPEKTFSLFALPVDRLSTYLSLLVISALFAEHVLFKPKLTRDLKKSLRYAFWHLLRFNYLGALMGALIMLAVTPNYLRFERPFWIYVVLFLFLWFMNPPELSTDPSVVSRVKKAGDFFGIECSNALLIGTETQTSRIKASAQILGLITMRSKEFASLNDAEQDFAIARECASMKYEQLNAARKPIRMFLNGFLFSLSLCFAFVYLTLLGMFVALICWAFVYIFGLGRFSKERRHLDLTVDEEAFRYTRGIDAASVT